MYSNYSKIINTKLPKKFNIISGNYQMSGLLFSYRPQCRANCRAQNETRGKNFPIFADKECLITDQLVERPVSLGNQHNMPGMRYAYTYSYSCKQQEYTIQITLLCCVLYKVLLLCMGMNCVREKLEQNIERMYINRLI